MTRKFITELTLLCSLGTGGEHEITARITYSYTRGTSSHYDKLHGWQPGDEPEVDVEKIERPWGDAFIEFPNWLVEEIVDDSVKAELATDADRRMADDADEAAERRAEERAEHLRETTDAR